jgi:hypothetical protein
MLILVFGLKLLNNTLEIISVFYLDIMKNIY